MITSAGKTNKQKQTKQNKTLVIQNKYISTISQYNVTALKTYSSLAHNYLFSTENHPTLQILQLFSLISIMKFSSEQLSLTCYKLGVLCSCLRCDKKLGVQKHLFLEEYILWSKILHPSEDLISSISLDHHEHSNFLLFINC